MVFDQEFHVHSVVLKIGSKYFRKFMDSPVSHLYSTGYESQNKAAAETR
jgi:hypothetical protein